jgi:hypothetical protein
MTASFPLVASKDTLLPRNLRLLRRRRISFTLGETDVDDSSRRAKCVQGLTSAEARKRGKEGPPTLPGPRMAKDAARAGNLRCVQAEEPPTEKRRRIGDRAG